MVIKEFLPNPIGKDTEGEYLILLNDGQLPANLDGWQLKDLSGKTFRLTGYALSANEELKLFYKNTKIALNNNGETLYLSDPAGTIVNELSYSGSAAEGRIVSQAIELSEEVKAELFENFPNNLPAVSLSIPLTQLLLFMVLAGAILAALSLWVIKKAGIEIWPKQQAGQ